MQQFNTLLYKNTLLLNAKEIAIYGKVVKKVLIYYQYNKFSIIAEKSNVLGNNFVL